MMPGSPVNVRVLPVFPVPASSVREVVMIDIIFNGSEWAGEPPDTIDKLLEVLSRHTLDPRFEKYGNFVCADTSDKYIRDGHLQAIPGAFRFFGNFIDISHVFNIRTDEPAIIKALTDAIEANKQTQAYLENRPEPVQKVMWRNEYCHCGQEWEDIWDSACSDRCPVCNAEIEPYHSEEVSDAEQI